MCNAPRNLYLFLKSYKHGRYDDCIADAYVIYNAEIGDENECAETLNFIKRLYEQEGLHPVHPFNNSLADLIAEREQGIRALNKNPKRKAFIEKYTSDQFRDLYDY